MAFDSPPLGPVADVASLVFTPQPPALSLSGVYTPNPETPVPELVDAVAATSGSMPASAAPLHRDNSAQAGGAVSPAPATAVGFDLLYSAAPVLSSAALLLRCMYGLFPNTTVDHIRSLLASGVASSGGSGSGGVVVISATARRVIAAVMAEAPFLCSLFDDPSAELSSVGSRCDVCRDLAS